MIANLRARLPILALASCLVMLVATEARSQPGPSGGELVPGPYRVGFRTAWAFDPSRSYRLLLEGGRVEETDGPRPLLVATWYPARADAITSPMAYGGYLDYESDDRRARTLSRALVAHHRDVWTQSVFDAPEEGLSERQREAWLEFLASPTRASRDAPAAPGRFPLLLYHPGAGSTYEENSILFEYLASHGYIVISSAFQDGDGTSLDTYGGSASLGDMDALLARAKTMPGVDETRVALSGYSAGAQAVMRRVARSRDGIDALVVLDTTQDYHGLAMPIWEFTRPVLANVENFDVPILVVAESAAVFSLMDRLVRAERHYLTLSDVEHGEFISLGISARRWARTRPSGSPPDDRDSRADPAWQYGIMCAYVRAFLDARLRGRPEDLDAMAARWRTTRIGSGPHVERVPKGASAPPPYRLDAERPPSPRQLRDQLRRHGLHRVTTLLERHESGRRADPIYDETFAFAWIYELLEEGSHAWARSLFGLYQFSYNDALRPTFLRYCRIGRLLSQHSFARRCVENLLRVDPGNSEARELRATWSTDREG